VPGLGGLGCMAARHFEFAEQSRQKALRDDPNFPDAASAKAALARISKDPNPNLPKRSHLKAAVAYRFTNGLPA
jgi:hypothetical protein